MEERLISYAPKEWLFDAQPDYGLWRNVFEWHRWKK